MSELLEFFFRIINIIVPIISIFWLIYSGQNALNGQFFITFIIIYFLYRVIINYVKFLVAIIYIPHYLFVNFIMFLSKFINKNSFLVDTLFVLTSISNIITMIAWGVIVICFLNNLTTYETYYPTLLLIYHISTIPFIEYSAQEMKEGDLNEFNTTVIYTYYWQLACLIVILLMLFLKLEIRIIVMSLFIIMFIPVQKFYNIYKGKLNI